MEIHFSTDVADLDRTAWDIVHLFDVFDMEVLYPYARRARELGIPIVLSANYWSPYEYYYASSRSGFSWLANNIFPISLAMNWSERRERGKRTQTYAAQSEVIHWSHTVVTSSQAERVQLIEEYAICNTEKVKVIHDTILPDSTEIVTSAEFAEKYGVHDCVLCVGDFDERHNQLSLIQALRRTNIPIVFIGGTIPGQQDYLAECKKATNKINGKVLFIEQVESPTMIRSAMKNARVHVVPSWWETTLQMSMDAVLCGCNVVVTDRSPFREYLADTAFLCNPSSLDSLRQSVLYAYTTSRNQERGGIFRPPFDCAQEMEALNSIYTAALQGKEVNPGC